MVRIQHCINMNPNHPPRYLIWDFVVECKHHLGSVFPFEVVFITYVRPSGHLSGKCKHWFKHFFKRPTPSSCSQRLFTASWRTCACEYVWCDCFKCLVRFSTLNHPQAALAVKYMWFVYFCCGVIYVVTDACVLHVGLFSGTEEQNCPSPRVNK